MSNSTTKLDSNFVCLKRIFNCSLLIFQKNAKISKWRLILATILMLIATYHLFSISYYIIIWRNEVTAVDFIKISFAFQAFVSMCLILRWQFGPFQLIFDTNTWTQFGYAIFSSSKMKKRLIQIYVTYSLFAIATISSSVFQIANYLLGHIRDEMLPKNIHKGFGGKKFITAIGLTFDIYLLCIWIIVFLFYSVILNVFCEILRHFNQELKCFGQNDNNLNDRIKKLSTIYDKQVNLMVLLRQMNSTFEVFSCLNIGPTIIILIASLYTCCRGVMSENLSESMRIAPFVIFYLWFLVEIAGPPSRIHLEAKEIKINALLNKNIWASRNNELYQIGSMIVMNAKEGEWTISLWRFAPMTKSMLLTIGSVTITYLTIVLQMKSEVKTAHNLTSVAN